METMIDRPPAAVKRDEGPPMLQIERLPDWRQRDEEWLGGVTVGSLRRHIRRVGRRS